MTLIDRIAAAAAQLHGLPGFPVIETDRLLLRAAELADLEPMLELFSDRQAMRYWSRQPMRSLAEAQALSESHRSNFARREAINWILAERDSHRMVGTCSLYDLQPGHLRCAVGYALLPSAQGRGLASEAVNTASAWALQYLGLNRIEADIHPDNLASRKVLLRCGFRSEGVLRQRFVTATEIQDSEILARLAGSD